MGERKVLNKYIPPDFDPALIPRGKKLSAKDGTVPVRMMLPFTAQCSTCHTFLYRGTKFNSKKEAMGGPDGTYLGITRWRFYIKCTSCARPLTFLTDPKNADYEMESGGTRNYEVYKDKAETEEAAVQAQEEEEKLDPMKALENRVLDSQREMQDMANLEAIRAMNTRHVHLLLSNDSKGVLGDGDMEGEGVDADDKAVKDELLTEEDEALIKSIQFGSKATSTASSLAPASSIYSNELRRLDDKDEERLERDRQRALQQLERQQNEVLNRTINHTSNHKKSLALPVIVKKRKRVIPSDDSKAVEEAEAAAETQATKDASAAVTRGNGEGGDESTKSAASTDPTSANKDSNGGRSGAADAASSATATGLSSLLGGYGSDDDESDDD